jgi:hypothetical protein
MGDDNTDAWACQRIVLKSGQELGQVEREREKPPKHSRMVAPTTIPRPEASDAVYQTLALYARVV